MISVKLQDYCKTSLLKKITSNKKIKVKKFYRDCCKASLLKKVIFNLKRVKRDVMKFTPPRMTIKLDKTKMHDKREKKKKL